MIIQNGFRCQKRHFLEHYSVLWKSVHDSSRPRGQQQHSCAMLWHSVHCDSPLPPWVMKGLINESIRVSVCCSLCVSGMQSGPDVPSLRAHRGKGCHCWQNWWMGGIAAPWQRRMWQPPSPKREAVLNYQGEIMWCWPPPFPSYIPYWLCPRWGKNQSKDEYQTESYQMTSSLMFFLSSMVYKSNHKVKRCGPRYSVFITFCQVNDGNNKRFFKL